MNQNRVASLIGTVLLLCPLAAAPAGAQGIVVKKKVVSPDQYQKMVAPDTRAALSGETLRNGDYVSVQRKGETNRINGVFVYEDAQKIYVRSQPQAAPTGVPLKEIEDIDRIVPANTEKAKGGSIRFATEDLSGAPPREIHVLHVYNGTTKEVRYYGPTLSAAEKQDLAALEKAANELATDQEMAQALERSLAEPAGRTDTAAARAPSGPGFAWDFYSTTNVPLPGFGFGSGLPFMLPYMMMNGGSSPTINVTLPAAAPPPSLAEQEKSLQSARERVEKDRQAYQTARNRAIFDSNGDIVAVRFADK